MKLKYKIVTGIFVGFIFLIATFFIIYHPSNEHTGLVAITTVSSDGNYVFTTDADHNAVLWCIHCKTKKIISHNANMYSAYWIKDTSYFMWQQNRSGIVSIQDANNLKVIKTLHIPYLIFGQAMSGDLKYNIFSTSAWSIFVGEEHYAKRMIKNYDDVPGFEGGGKLINFTFLGNDKLLTSGLTYSSVDAPSKANGVDLWDLKTRKKIRSYIGNVAKTFATVSPDGKYVVSVDEDAGQFVWETHTGKKLVEIVGNEPVIKHVYPGVITDHNIIKPPADTANMSLSMMSVKFIDATHYLRFNTMSHYAVLYDVLDPKPLKYLDLGEKPYVETWSYERDQSLDTSPSANILVMAKQEEPGILVYHYDPNTQTLTKVWDAT